MNPTFPEQDPFRLKFYERIKRPIFRNCVRMIEPVIERMLCLDKIGRGYCSVLEDPREMHFSEKVLEKMRITVGLRPDALSRIPTKGGVIIVANHPFGAIEGFILAMLLRKRRKDVKIVANYLLHRVTAFKDLFIFVDPFNTKDSSRKNIIALRESMKWVSSGGALVVFPAGEVSSFELGSRGVTDPAWSATIGGIIRKTEAPVLPIFFEGSNSLLFQLAGIIHPLLRTALIPRELYNKCGRELRVSIGNIVSRSRLQRFGSDKELISYLRFRTYLLSKGPKRAAEKQSLAVGAARSMEKIVPAVDPQLLDAEISSLPEEQILDRSGDYVIAYSRTQETPFVLREIGRLRELTFREAHEGTGRSIDIDRFDNYYIHLYVWNDRAKEIVGAYRLAPTDRVFAKFGVKGLYTHTLFAYSSKLLQQMGPALELGRSFVRVEYQKNYSSLHLLWKGIALYVAKYPRYRILFGTVSISAEYGLTSRKLIKAFLEENNYLPELAKQVRARNPIPRGMNEKLSCEARKFAICEISEISELIRELEANDKGLPVLLRQYLRLGGRLLGFNLDRTFGHVLDGLIYVDLCETEPRILERYLGKSGVSTLLKFHQDQSKPLRRIA